ncbi:hypothetical protein Bca52824_072814 [Brassica carinata]|uniref:Clp R domain-containing protein n=1 Tax=Brassica carinata TaxID=52824 RepID=A0A8X7QBV9_BRACI|nr:hypothetical protein Bca52824_072814 [Brassica carinata]
MLSKSLRRSLSSSSILSKSPTEMMFNRSACRRFCLCLVRFCRNPFVGHNYIGPEHLLLGLLREGEGVAARVLENLAVDASNIRMQLYCEKEKLSDDQFLVTFFS